MDTEHISSDWPWYRLHCANCLFFCVSLIKTWLSKRKIKLNESGSWKLVNDSVLLSNKKKYNVGSLCTDCNYCTFSEWGCLQLQTVTSARLRVMTPSLSHCLNKGRVSAGIINEQENMQAAPSPFWPPWILCLTSQKSNIDCCSIATDAYKSPWIHFLCDQFKRATKHWKGFILAKLWAEI